MTLAVHNFTSIVLTGAHKRCKPCGAYGLLVLITVQWLINFCYLADTRIHG